MDILKQKIHIGELLKKKRGDRSFYEVAKKGSLRVEQVKDIEEGEKAYTIDVFLKLCNALDVECKLQ